MAVYEACWVGADLAVFGVYQEGRGMSEGGYVRRGYVKRGYVRVEDRRGYVMVRRAYVRKVFIRTPWPKWGYVGALMA